MYEADTAYLKMQEAMQKSMQDSFAVGKQMVDMYAQQNNSQLAEQTAQTVEEEQGVIGYEYESPEIQSVFNTSEYSATTSPEVLNAVGTTTAEAGTASSTAEAVTAVIAL